jgi:hypothetical protein
MEVGETPDENVGPVVAVVPLMLGADGLTVPFRPHKGASNERGEGQRGNSPGWGSEARTPGRNETGSPSAGGGLWRCRRVTAAVAMEKCAPAGQAGYIRWCAAWSL